MISIISISALRKLKMSSSETVLISWFFSSPGKWHLGLNCENSTDFCHHPSAHGFRHFFGIPLTNLRDCGSGHGTVFQVQKYLPYRTAAIVCATATILHCIGVVAISYRRILRVMALFVTLALLFGGFILAIPYFNCILMRDLDVVEQPFNAENLTQRMTQEAVDFIERCLHSLSLARFSHTFVQKYLRDLRWAPSYRYAA